MKTEVEMNHANQVFVGLDLGQTLDHSAIAVVERVEQRTAWSAPVLQSMTVRYLERIPLATLYTRVVDRVWEVVRNPSIAGRCKLVADATGVGAPVVDLLRTIGLKCPITAVTITGGAREHGAYGRWHVPKKDLLSGVLLLLEQGQLRISGEMAECETLARELTNVEIRRKTGGVQMGAEGAGQHDDLVFAVALACWRAKKKEIGFGTQPLF